MNERQLGTNIEFLMRLKGIRADEMAGRMGMGTSTFYNRRNRPGTFTIAEVNKAAEILKVEVADLFKSLY